jgi:transcriptional regulator with XRE-family HTH domain
MASQHLPNYLLKYRKRSALSQEEVAYLLGAQGGAKVCRYERFLREPGLQTALAYEAIFDRPVSELFPGLFERTRIEVSARAKKLEQKEFRGSSVRLTARKRQALAAIASREPKEQLKQS